MREFRLRSDLKRAVIDGFALPLGVEPGDLAAPTQGYTVTYNAGEDDEPDTYSFHVVISHEQLRPLLERAFELLPEEVHTIVEIGSRDAYRSVDVFLGGESVPREQFLRSWKQYEPLLLEDATIAAGANSEDPFVEVFVDMWKGVAIHVPLNMREEVEDLLHEFGLEEVPETWPIDEEEGNPTNPGPAQIRPVLDLTDEYSPDLDELLLTLRHEWQLELNIDPDSNIDDAGRHLGLTLWHAVVIVEPASDNDEAEGAYVSIWATAGSMVEMEMLIDAAMEQLPDWEFSEVFTLDRVAYDERPDDLADLPPRRDKPDIHMIQIDAWGVPPEELRRG